MTAQLERTPFLALSRGSGGRWLYFHVPRNLGGEIDAGVARWLDQLEGPRDEDALEADLAALGVREARGLLRRLHGARLLIDPRDRDTEGFEEPIIIAGYGLCPASDASAAALAVLRDARRLLVMDVDYRARQLSALNPRVVSLDHRFDEAPRGRALEQIARDVIEACLEEKGSVFALYGNPRVGSFPTSVLLRLATERNLAVRILPGASFLERAFVDFDFDPFDGFSLLAPRSLAAANPSLHTIIGAVGYERDDEGKRAQLTEITAALLAKYAPTHPVHVVIARGEHVERRRLSIAELPSLAGSLHAGGTSFYLPPASCASSSEGHRNAI